MPAFTGTAENTGLIIDRKANTIRLVRELPAPPPDIFDAWTHPDQLKVWWDPTGKPLSECTIDLRLGGSFKFVSLDHPEMPFGGVYCKIERPDRLEFAAMGATGRVEFDAISQGTLMTVEITCSSPEHLEQYLKMGVHTGTAKTLDNLVVFITKRA